MAHVGADDVRFSPPIHLKYLMNTIDRLLFRISKHVKCNLRILGFPTDARSEDLRHEEPQQMACTGFQQLHSLEISKMLGPNIWTPWTRPAKKDIQKEVHPLGTPVLYRPLASSNPGIGDGTVIQLHRTPSHRLGIEATATPQTTREGIRAIREFP